VICPKLDAEAVARTGAELAGHPRVREVRFIDDTGDWNTDPTYPDGLYLGLQCRSPVGEVWKVDIWFVADPDRQPDLTHARDLPRRLTAETRAAILVVKDAWAGRPEYGRDVRSWDIYTAVVDHGCGLPRNSRTGCGAVKPDHREQGERQRSPRVPSAPVVRKRRGDLVRTGGRPVGTVGQG
jgi:hypothetical protein